VKYVLLQLAILLGSGTLLVAVGYTFTEARWGAEGLQSMWAAAGICLFTAIVAAIPLGFAATWWPQWIGHAVLAGTTIRLFATAMLGLAWQMVGNVHLVSFLAWLLALYLLLLVAETIFSAVLVRRTCFPGTAEKR
jgi:hypothetical protein